MARQRIYRESQILPQCYLSQFKQSHCKIAHEIYTRRATHWAIKVFREECRSLNSLASTSRTSDIIRLGRLVSVVYFNYLFVDDCLDMDGSVSEVLDDVWIIEKRSATSTIVSVVGCDYCKVG